MSYYIYKICCDDLPDFVYVGSTKAFRERKYQHKKKYNKEHSQKIYTTIRENGGWDNWRMVIIEECGEINFTQARIKEEEHRVKLNANLNMQKCHITEEEKKERDKYMQTRRRRSAEVLLLLLLLLHIYIHIISLYMCVCFTLHYNTIRPTTRRKLIYAIKEKKQCCRRCCCCCCCCRCCYFWCIFTYT